MFNLESEAEISGDGILVIGDVMLDKYWFSTPESLACDAPVLNVTVDDTDYRAGGAANVVLNIRKLANESTPVSILAPLGDDQDGFKLETILDDNKVNCHWQAKSSNSTITKHRIISNKQQLVRVDFEKCYQPIEINDQVCSLIEKHKVIIFSDYNKGALLKIKDLISHAKKLAKIILVDPKGQDFAKYTGASMLTPNLSEFLNIVGVCSDTKVRKRMATQLISDLDLKALLITLGAEGMQLYLQNGKDYHACSYAEQVFDVTGAGDTVIASMATCLAEGMCATESLDFASHAAAQVVSQVGTAFVSREQVNNSKNHYSHQQADNKPDSKLIEIKNLADLGSVLNFTQAELILYHWNFFEDNILTRENFSKLEQVKKQRHDTKKLVVLLHSQSNKKSLKNLTHTVEELGTMLSQLTIVDSVIFSKELDLSLLLANISAESQEYKVLENEDNL